VVDRIDALERLQKLRESGALTAEEFEEQKRVVLSEGANEPVNSELQSSLNASSPVIGDETKGKLIDGTKVIAKSAAMLGLTAFSFGMAPGGSIARGIIPRPINMWKNERREREIRKIVESVGIPLDFTIKVTYLKNGNEETFPITSWQAWNNFGWSKWELAFWLFKYEGSMIVGEKKEGFFGYDTRRRVEIFE
jgi:hypothetical protein